MAEVHPVLLQPAGTPVLDLSGPGPWPSPRWSIGRYDEVRGIYTQALFQGGRCVHMGIDLGGPAGVAVHSPLPATVIRAADNDRPGDYGPTLVLELEREDGPRWLLLGHLSRASLRHSPVGRRVAAGDVVGWLGDQQENGGWPPHVHVQLSAGRPELADLPGAVRLDEREAARRRYPDPRGLLGPLYPD